jgi:hypothetical protein
VQVVHRLVTQPAAASDVGDAQPQQPQQQRVAPSLTGCPFIFSFGSAKQVTNVKFVDDMTRLVAPLAPAGEGSSTDGASFSFKVQ